MRTAGIQGARRGRKILTTRPDPGDVRAPDLVKRDFTATALDLLWVADFTYCSTWQGWLNMAVWSRNRPRAGLGAHTDAGAQYTALRYTESLADIAAATSFGNVAGSYDNAISETLNGIFKTEMHKLMGPKKLGTNSNTRSTNTLTGTT
jgi:putative transposase